tara:strand:+ start:2983 stop:3270 length:288 start_codon:yes stop_codon:yes gene_type:complete
MNNLKSFETFSQAATAADSQKIAEEKSALQNEYQEYFLALLHKYDISSVSELDEEGKKKFFDELSNGYKAGDGTNDTGEEVVKDAEDDGADLDTE